MMVPSWIPIIIRHLIFRVPKKRTTILTTTHIHTPRSEDAGGGTPPTCWPVGQSQAWQSKRGLGFWVRGLGFRGLGF